MYLCRKNNDITTNDMKITLIKHARNVDTLRAVEMESVVESIRSGEYVKPLEETDDLWDSMLMERSANDKAGSLDKHWRQVPRICFASVLENRQQQRVRKGYTGLILLEVNNLTGWEEASAVRKGAGQMPQTLLAFVGVSGRSVKIVCRGELADRDADGLAKDGLLPSEDEAVRRFHLNLYEKARMAYNAQLGVTIEKTEPALDYLCFISYDPEAVYNPLAIPLYTDSSEMEHAVQPIRSWTQEPDELLPGLNRYDSMHHLYEFCLQKAYDDVEGFTEEEGRTHLLLTRLAGYCLESELPMAVAQRLAIFGWTTGRDPNLVREVFSNTYHDDNEKRYRKRQGIKHPLKNIPPETLLTMKIDIFLNENYEIRKNVMRGVAEYRQRTGRGFDFQDLTEEARNSITMQALKLGIKCWDKDIRRYVSSNDIQLYNPINDFLEHLPRWDGKDRVMPLAQRVPTSYQEWPLLFHIWMRSMVAMWLGKGQLTGNALVPLLIGRQGCGKSSFCRILLPRDQREYYNDRINFKNEQDLNLGLTSFALINLDEFDKITQRQQIVLKYLVSTADLKYRPPYGKAYTVNRRYASFIGTTNEQMPLTDPSGSRRFVCVSVEGDIDFQTPVEYPQLYAQLYHEVSRGERYWLTKDEEQALMHHNLNYQQLNGIGEMLMSIFRRPATGEQGVWMSIKDISARLKQTFRGAYKEDAGNFIKIGQYLSRPEYKFSSRRKTNGYEYLVMVR